MAARVEIRFEPPALTNGRALPATGIRPIIMVMLMRASMMIQKDNPAAMIEPSKSGAREAITRPRQSRIPYKPISPSAPNIPNSSTITAKMLSVAEKGRPTNLVVAFPMPTPSHLPR